MKDNDLTPGVMDVAKSKEGQHENRSDSVYVDDQEKALRFYTDVLGFVKKADVTQGPFRWLTIASPAEPDGVELRQGFQPKSV